MASFGQTPAHYFNKTPFGFGDTNALMPFNPTGDMSRAMAPMDFDRSTHSMENFMNREMDRMRRLMAHPGDMNRNMQSMHHAMQRDVQQQLAGMNHEMQRMMQNVDRSFTTDLVHHPSRPASIMEHYSLMNPIHTDPEGNRWLNCCFDLRSYKPEEISITLNSKERCINVDASHEVRDSKDHYIRRHYARKFYLPENINCDLNKLELKSCLTKDGMLCVESALPKLSIEEAQKTALTTPSTFSIPIPVKHI